MIGRTHLVSHKDNPGSDITSLGPRTYTYEMDCEPKIWAENFVYSYRTRYVFTCENCVSQDEAYDLAARWCIDNIGHFNKIIKTWEDGHKSVWNTPLALICKNCTYKNGDVINLGRGPMTVYTIQLRGKYVEPKEVQYSYNPSEEIIVTTEDFFSVTKQPTKTTEQKHIEHNVDLTMLI